MNTPDALYAECCRTPGEDIVRLALADALDERGGPGDADRATFIRAQLELKATGRPPKAIHAPVSNRGGPNYYSVECDRGFVGVGDRVDVEPYVAAVGRAEGKRARTLHRLRVVRVEQDGIIASMETLTLARDADSTPFPRARWKDLRAMCRTLLAVHWARWKPAVVRPPGPGVLGCVPSRLGVTRNASRESELHFELRFRRGLADVVEAAWPSWRWFAADHVLDRIPLATVRFVTWPQLQWQDDTKRNMRVFALAGQERSDPSLRVAVEVPRKELDAQPDPDVMPPRVARELLQKRWPSVCEWQLPDDPDTDYWTADED